MLKINVITQLVMLIVFAILANQLHVKTLMLLFFLMFGLILIIKKAQHFIKSIKRFRWLFAVMMLVYTFNTPGQHIQGWPFDFAPTYEGALAGLTQAMRISIILATITLMMAINTKQQLVSAFYYMLLPFKCIGLQADRFSARLWLTLHYVELQHTADSRDTFMGQLKTMTNLKSDNALAGVGQQNHQSSAGNAVDEITLMMPQFTLTDFVVIVGFVLMLIRVLL